MPLSRRLPQQHKSPKVLVAALAMPGKASHIQIIEDSSCWSEQHALTAYQNIQQSSTKPSQQADVSESRIGVISITNQKNELDAAPDQRRYLVGRCARVDDRTILLDRAQDSLDSRRKDTAFSTRVRFHNIVREPDNVICRRCIAWEWGELSGLVRGESLPELAQCRR